MFEYCTDPSSLDSLQWWSCYLTTNKQIMFYQSFGTVLALLLATAPVILLFGFGGALARRSRFLPLRLFGLGYTSMVRGIPDIIFFMFALIALDQGIEYVRHIVLCPDWTEPVRQGNDFVVCAAAKMPPNNAPQWVHEVYGFFLALVGYSIVYGAFAANTLFGAFQAVPHAQLETAAAFGMSRRKTFWRILLPQMWVYALPGLSNLWMILVKATPLLFLLGVKDIVYWANELGGAKTARFTYPHGDWRLGYFLVLLAFYLILTWVSERGFERLNRYVSRGHASRGGST